MAWGFIRFASRVVVCLALVLAFATIGNSYSVLTHEEIIDLLWKDQIAPLLLRRFPRATPEDLRRAHAFAYGGSMLQDMGYYPFGNKYFSDLVHYVRSGDFVENLISESTDINEYAFALGALAHYASDTTGHPTVNRIVSMEFPRLARKYGERVNYAQDPKAHIQAEFGLDMEQVAKNRFTSDAYHDFIGFEVSKPLLQRAFKDTYGIELSDIIKDLDLSIGSYRRAISKVIPKMTKAALLYHKQQLVKDVPNFNEKKFRYYLSRAQYERQWGNNYRKPGFGTRVLSFFLRIVPKIGPFRALAFRDPNPTEEAMYVRSVDQTVDDYRKLLADTGSDKLNLANIDFDTGRLTQPGEYVLTDKSYARLLDELAKRHFSQVTPDLREDILKFYADANAPNHSKEDSKQWQKTMAELQQLRAMPELSPIPSAALSSSIPDPH
ncbi:MAG TPA: zinc dependent phospholipase C family protein [Terriglobales bacterium]|nr:zinc dependent phospholipase C family protein [Terriglobales bacterium]